MRTQDINRGAQALAGLTQSKEAELLRSAQSGGTPKTKAEESEVGKAFETYFATMLVKEMRKVLPEGFFSGSGSDIYGSWFDEHLGASLAQRDSLGMAGMIKTAIERSATTDAMALDEEALGAATTDSDEVIQPKREGMTR